VRKKDFFEVNLGYTPDEAVKEAERCLQCSNPPCVKGCPVNIDIPGFIKKIKEGNIEESAGILKETNNLPAVCGRVCPQETQCEGTCIMNRMEGFEPISIGKLERFAADESTQSEFPKIEVKKPQRKEKIAVVGSGPAGLTCAANLAKRGYGVIIYEALHLPGGVLVYGIPEFRLPKKIVGKEIDEVRKLGVRIEVDTIIGKTLTIDELRESFDAIFIGIGAGTPRMMNIPGSDLIGIYSSSEFLTRINLMKGFRFPEFDTPVKVGQKIIVVGGGNVAMDSARSALRISQSDVKVVYRRSEEQIPARIEEYHHAVEEGIEFHWLTNPVEYLSDEEGAIKAVKVQKMQLGDKDSSGRRRPVPIEGAYETMEADTVIEAIGQTPNKVLLDTFQDVRLNKKGNIEVDEKTLGCYPETDESSVEGIFAGGDIVTGAATVIEAMGAGKRAAASIDRYLKSRV